MEWTGLYYCVLSSVGNVDPSAGTVGGSWSAHTLPHPSSLHTSVHGEAEASSSTAFAAAIDAATVGSVSVCVACFIEARLSGRTLPALCANHSLFAVGGWFFSPPIILVKMSVVDVAFAFALSTSIPLLYPRVKTWDKAISNTMRSSTDTIPANKINMYFIKK